MPSNCSAVQALPFGVHVIDTGTNHAVPLLLDALRGAGLTPEAVDWLIVTHVHLDHAGGAGLLMQSLPNATLVVHSHGARHMINPTQLYQSARAVYGADEMARSYGTIVSVAAERVLVRHAAALGRVADPRVRRQRAYALLARNGFDLHGGGLTDLQPAAVGLVEPGFEMDG